MVQEREFIYSPESRKIDFEERKTAELSGNLLVEEDIERTCWNWSE